MTKFASQVLEDIIRIFENDEAVWSAEQINHANQKWETLADDAKNFLNTLSSEDLDSVCTGEARDVTRDDGSILTLRLYEGEWKTLPPAVDSFLTDIWEYA